VKRSVYSADHEAFREVCRGFVAAEVTPHLDTWERVGRTGRGLYTAAGKAGLLGFAFGAEHGGLDVGDFRYSAVLTEELVRAGALAVSMNLAGLNDLVAPYLASLLTDEQQARWAPGICDGSVITAIALSEPGAGSDMRAMRTRAERAADGGWSLSGSKTFVSNGAQADLVLVAARTGQNGMSLFLVPAGLPGFSRGEPLAKTCLKSQDTAELFFDAVPLPVGALVGEAGAGWGYLMANLPTERMSVAVTAIASCRAMLDMTLRYARERTAFGTPIGSFQANSFALAELATEVTIAEQFVDRCVSLLVGGELTAVDAAMAKWWVTELQQKVGYRCQQLHGGYGVMAEYPIAKAVLDARPSTIYAGTTEVMKLIIGRSLGL
jgi:alkylation response protein AidB-like acyl-CoA dehydrogenase